MRPLAYLSLLLHRAPEIERDDQLNEGVVIRYGLRTRNRLGWDGILPL